MQTAATVQRATINDIVVCGQSRFVLHGRCIEIAEVIHLLKDTDVLLQATLHIRYSIPRVNIADRDLRSFKWQLNV